MAYQVKYKLLSHMLPDKDDWASVEEFTTYHDTDNVDYRSDIIDGQAKYKSAPSVFSIESGLVFLTVTYNSEADRDSCFSDNRAARVAVASSTGLDLDRRTTQEIVSAAEV
jgi:hypothetical protein